MESPSVIEQVNALIEEAEATRSETRLQAIMNELTAIKQLLEDIKTNTSS